MELLLVGGGMLAVDLVAEAPAGKRLVALDHAALDVTNEDAVAEAIERVRPQCVINTSGFTRVDDAERDARAWAVNADAPGRIGRLCAPRGINVVHFSTDYVFDGAATVPYSEKDPPRPINVYGESKLAGEKALESSGARSLVIRTQWLYGSTGRSFPASMWERAAARTPTRVVNDQTGRPTSAVSLARAVWRLISANAEGTMHIANRGTATWFDIASRIFDALGALDVLLPCTTEEFGAAAARPRYSVLDTSKVEREAGIFLPHWTEALDAWIALKTARDTVTP